MRSKLRLLFRYGVNKRIGHVFGHIDQEIPWHMTIVDHFFDNRIVRIRKRCRNVHKRLK